ncbi:hypothetical protein C8Q77DRAFT_1082052 [Trametes polyzona]|nr:hypothetical protein C8Q77DRAFT_1082052 [Trametes polyzona]
MDVDPNESSSSTAPTSIHNPPAPGPRRTLPRIVRSPSSSLDSSSSSGSPNALWRFVRNSPPPPPPPARMPLGDLSAQGDEARGTWRRMANLEWACANSAARRKHGRYVYRDEDDSEGESSELSESRTAAAAAALGNEGRNSRLKRRWEQRRQDGSAVQRFGPSNSSGSRPVVDIPGEYTMCFPPDMVLGASLLLTLKHSPGSTQ